MPVRGIAGADLGEQTTWLGRRGSPVAASRRNASGAAASGGGMHEVRAGAKIAPVGADLIYDFVGLNSAP